MSEHTRRRPCHWCGARSHRAESVEESCLDQIVDMEIRLALLPSGPERRYLQSVLLRCLRRLPGWRAALKQRIDLRLFGIREALTDRMLR